MKTIYIKKESESLTKSGLIYRAYFEDGLPLYLGREVKYELIQDIQDNFMQEKIKFKDFKKVSESST